MHLLCNHFRYTEPSLPNQKLNANTLYLKYITRTQYNSAIMQYKCIRCTFCTVENRQQNKKVLCHEQLHIEHCTKRNWQDKEIKYGKQNTYSNEGANKQSRNKQREEGRLFDTLRHTNLTNHMIYKNASHWTERGLEISYWLGGVTCKICQ